MKEITLTNSDKVALVDDQDYETYKKYPWSLSPDGYVICGICYKIRYLHRLILRVQSGIVDHRNKNPLDNQKSNLRKCSISQNGQNRKLQKNNTSGYKGVVYVKRDSKWLAQIYINKVRTDIGYFANKLHAAIAYNRAAEKHFGQFASLNPIYPCAGFGL